MMTLPLKYLTFIVFCTVLCTSCDYGNMIEIQQKSDYYKVYVDSVLKLKPVKSYPNWGKMTKKHDSIKNEVIKVSSALKKDNAINKLIESTSYKFDTFKISSINSYEELNAKQSIKLLKEKIFNKKINNLQLNTINSSNILGAFVSLDQFTKEKSNELSNEEWEYVYIIYQALDTRKKDIQEAIASKDLVEINKVQPKIYALIKLNIIF